MANDLQRLGKYRILEELGRGGFATVYRAVDTALDREVALKILHPQLLTDRTFVQRFRNEARTVANLRHPHITTVFDIGELEERLFIAMELVRGPSLAHVIHERGRIPWEETLALLRPICDALEYAHGEGIVHRDLKPSNILLENTTPMLTDFGFARLMSESSISLSMSGGIVGTPGYIAPEVWDLNAAEAPADIYALGCVIYEMLTGQVLFFGETPMQALRAHDRGPQFPSTWPEDVPAGIEAVLHKALAHEPAARYTLPSALWHALNDLNVDAHEAELRRERDASIAQWRAEAESALQAGEWRVARMAIARWEALAPDDPDVQAARNKLEQGTEPIVPDTVEDVAHDVRQEQTEEPPVETVDGGRPPPPRPPKRRWWLWIAGGGVAVLGVVCMALVIVATLAAPPASTPTRVAENTATAPIVAVATITPVDDEMPPTPTLLPPDIAPPTAIAGGLELPDDTGLSLQLRQTVEGFLRQAYQAEAQAYLYGNAAYATGYYAGNALSLLQSAIAANNSQGVSQISAFDAINSYSVDVRVINEGKLEIDTCEYWTTSFYNYATGQFTTPERLLAPQTLTIEFLNGRFYITDVMNYAVEQSFCN